MITTVKNKKGFIVGYIESNKVNSTGYKDPKGIYIRIENLWIHEKLRRRGILELLGKKVYNHPFYRNCEFIYWIVLRSKQTNKKMIDEFFKGDESLIKAVKILPKNFLLKQNTKEPQNA